MNYGTAREILSEAIEQLDELNKATYRSYINKAAKDIKRRSVHGGFGASSVDGDGSFTTGDGDDEKQNRKVNRRIKGIGRAVKALDEADGNPAPFGYHVKKSPSGRKRYIPKTQKDFDSARKKFYAKYPGGEKAYWADINRRQREANHANRGEIAESIEQLDEASNLRRQRSRMAHREASLIRRAGGSQEEVRAALSGKRTPTAKSGLGLLAKAYKSASKNRAKKDPYFPYGKAESRRMSKYMD